MKAPPTMMTLEVVLHRDAAEIQAWVKEVRTGVLDPPDGFNWLGLAEAAAFNARRDAARVEAPLNDFSEEQQRMLRTAVCLEHSATPGAEPRLRAWLASALPALAWARAALATYGYLAGRSALRDKASYQDSAMHLRAFMIAKLGNIPGDRVLDADEILYWFFDGLKLTPQEAGARALAWRTRLAERGAARQVAELRRLRRIKNRVAALAVLAASGQLEPTPTLQAWLLLREQLP